MKRVSDSSKNVFLNIFQVFSKEHTLRTSQHCVIDRTRFRYSIKQCHHLKDKSLIKHTNPAAYDQIFNDLQLECFHPIHL